MRVAWLFVVIAGCGASSSRGPAWPKTAAVETDGGESLAPHTATAKAAAAAADDDGDDADEVKPAVPAAGAAKPAAAASDKPATPSATSTPADEPIMTEEIVIEIDD